MPRCVRESLGKEPGKCGSSGELVKSKRCPGMMRGNPGCAGRSHSCCVDPVGDAEEFLLHGWRCVDSSHRKSDCVIPIRRCSDFLTASQAVRRFSPHKEFSCRDEAFLALRLQEQEARSI
ncbi:hypothetical protein NDU88_001800 [Pleurodeles waltl]|uniref:Uncharacterized protein n=1 Tax=Pleurodeles waltl TaxID=8319 RepID=A0AAV7NBS8_PLEWA|nr:hypothetical protein NDU88_001800 [Pleurodeles waltl]